MSETHEQNLAAGTEITFTDAGAIITEPSIPRAEKCGRYLAECNDGRLLYLNHANTWQECPNFIARLRAENERLTAELAETEKERAAAFEDADQASESARRSEKIGMEWKARALAAEAREAKAVEDVRAKCMSIVATWQNECAGFPDLHNQGNVLLDRIAAVRALPTEAQNDA
ncbi:MAG: hypothetical protein ACTHJQ_25305 [Rhizobiaceae bacterium]